MSKPVYYKRSANRSEFFLIHISFIWTGSLLVPTNIVYQSLLPDSWWWIGRQVHVTLQMLIPITQPRPISSMPDFHTFYSSIYMHTHIIKNPKPSLHILWYQILTFFSLCFVTFIIFLSNTMAIRLPGIMNAKHILRRSNSFGKQAASIPIDVPKGYIAVYVGESEKRRFVIPISFLNQPSFLTLLSKAEEEFGYDHPMGGLTIPCSENIFIDLASHLHELWNGATKRKQQKHFCKSM